MIYVNKSISHKLRKITDTDRHNHSIKIITTLDMKLCLEVGGCDVMEGGVTEEEVRVILDLVIIIMKMIMTSCQHDSFRMT